MLRCLGSPRGQTALLGVVFLLVFSAYLVIQTFSSKLYGERLASAMEATLYAVFTLACFISPAVTNKLGTRLTMFLGVLGYAALVAASLVYFLERGACSSSSSGGGLQGCAGSALVVLGGGVLGVGASLLWTAQGRLLLQYMEMVGPQQAGRLFSLFWGLFNTAALLGGVLTFAYFSKQGEDAGSAALYVVFLCLLLLGACATFLLRVPSDLSPKQQPQQQEDRRELASPLLYDDGRGVEDEEVSGDGWVSELSATLRLFRSPRMLALSLLFFNTGFSQPYQLATFGGRFFDKQTLGLELVLFYGMQIVGSAVLGSLLDRLRSPASRRHGSRGLLALLSVLGLAASATAMALEGPHRHNRTVAARDYRSVSVVVPSLAFAMWGLLDVVTQTWSYWLLGQLHEHKAKDQARAVGFYKMVGSAGWSVGFALLPRDRLTPWAQLLATALLFQLGVALAWLSLPRPPSPSRPPPSPPPAMRHDSTQDPDD